MNRGSSHSQDYRKLERDFERSPQNSKEAGKCVDQTIFHSKGTNQMVWGSLDENSKMAATKIASRDKASLGEGEGNQAEYMKITQAAIILATYEERQRGRQLDYPALVEVPNGSVCCGRADKESHS